MISKALTEPAGTPQEAIIAFGARPGRGSRRKTCRSLRPFCRGKRIGWPISLMILIGSPLKSTASSSCCHSRFLRARQFCRLADSSPIFIVGLPRSGTTLVERILGRHHLIEGAGELQIIPRLAELPAVERITPMTMRPCWKLLGDAQLAWVGKRYVEASRDHRRPKSRCFIDKANLNWMQIGLIVLALPDAKVIDVRRNALDCCWANFKMLFAEGYAASNDLASRRAILSRLCPHVRCDEGGRTGSDSSVRYEDVVDRHRGPNAADAGFPRARIRAAVPRFPPRNGGRRDREQRAGSPTAQPQGHRFR